MRKIKIKSVKKDSVYHCACKNCRTIFEIQPQEFVYDRGLNLKWLCPACDQWNAVNILRLQQEKVDFGGVEVHYED